MYYVMLRESVGVALSRVRGLKRPAMKIVWDMGRSHSHECVD